MSTIDQVLKATTELTHTVSTECQRIEAKLIELEALRKRIESWELEAKLPYFSLSRNQLGNVTNGNLDHYYVVDNDCEATFSIYKRIKTDIVWENRDKEEQAILTAMGKGGTRYTLPEFNVVRLKWKLKHNALNRSNRLFVQHVLYHSWMTYGCYAKLVEGAISKDRGGYFQNITNDWSLCGHQSRYNATSYATPHPCAVSDEGEVLFCMLTTIAGYLPLDKDNPRWGYFPYLEQNMHSPKLLAESYERLKMV